MVNRVRTPIHTIEKGEVFAWEKEEKNFFFFLTKEQINKKIIINCLYKTEQRNRKWKKKKYCLVASFAFESIRSRFNKITSNIFINFYSFLFFFYNNKSILRAVHCICIASLRFILVYTVLPWNKQTNDNLTVTG